MNYFVLKLPAVKTFLLYCLKSSMCFGVCLKICYSLVLSWFLFIQLCVSDTDTQLIKNNEEAPTRFEFT